jgi:RNA polymerase sigma factor (sigma-70 family)
MDEALVPAAQDVGMFPGTITQILRDAGAGSEVARNQVAERYLPPLYAFARTLGCSHEDAEDEASLFLSGFLNRLEGWRPEVGKFRTFLASSFRNHLRDSHRRRTAARRGGAAVHVPIRWNSESTGFAPVGGEDPAVAFDRVWAQSVYQCCLRQLGDEQRKLGNGARFDELLPLMLGGRGDERLSERERQALSRLRKRLRTILRELVAWPGATEPELKAELAYLHEQLVGHAPHVSP